MNIYLRYMPEITLNQFKFKVNYIIITVISIINGLKALKIRLLFDFDRRLYCTYNSLRGCF